MTDRKLMYRIPCASWSLEFPSNAVMRLMSHAQRRRWSKESVGQLYSADIASDVVRIDAVTTLSSKWSSHTGVRLDMPTVLQERADFFANGLHCLGFWHTHPEPVPRPSPADILMAADHARAGADVFAGFLFVIVGTAPAPDGLGVWIHDGTTLWHAVPVSDESA
jgi:proteasome lid subunit RPN8/RPN11